MHISYTHPNTNNILSRLQETLHYMDTDSPRLVDILWLHRKETLDRDTTTRRYRTDNREESVTLADMIGLVQTPTALTEAAQLLYPGAKIKCSVHRTDHVYRVLLTVHIADDIESLVAMLCLGCDDVLVATGVGEDLLVESFVNAIKSHYDARRFIRYSHLIGFSSNGPDVKETSLSESESKKWIGNDSFYPFIEGGLAKLAKDFSDNRASVLLLMGKRGTGKTTMVRTLNILLNRDENVICNNEEVLANPGLMPFLHRCKDGSTISIEDADNFCASRESGNAQMSSLLSFTDGGIHTRSKLIIVTNLTNLNKVDSALIRKGRTFRVIEFRELTPDEANAARQSIGKGAIDDYGKDSVTLAEALLWEEGDNTIGATNLVGFGR